MPTEVFFNRPGKPISLDRLCEEILGARSSLIVACAWLTQSTVVDAIIGSAAEKKLVIFNQSDLVREHRAGYYLYSKIDAVASKSASVACAAWAKAGSDPARVAEFPALVDTVVLGGDDFREGIMHHKFIVIDERVVWTGSYNMTYQAAKNFETLLRIADVAVAAEFMSEAAVLQSWLRTHPR